MFCIRMHATPSPESLDHGRVCGAYIVCWIVAASLEEATERAQQDVQAFGWRPDSIEHAAQTIRTECGSDRARELYDQAMIDQEVYEYHTYPLDDSEATDA
jgi:hypothetical protein